jgi:hypothetical protein
MISAMEALGLMDGHAMHYGKAPLRSGHDQDGSPRDFSSVISTMGPGLLTAGLHQSICPELLTVRSHW